MEALAAAGAWALKHWKGIGTLIGFAILGLMLAAAKSDARHWHKVADGNHDLFVGEQVMHGITAESLRLARLTIVDNNRRIREAADRLEADKRQAAADEARQAERWRGTAATIAALEADARRQDRKPCTISPAAKAALEDL